MARISWTAGASGAWTDPADWSPAQVPGASDDAVIAAPGTYAVDVDGASVNSITLDDPSAILLSGGTLLVNAGLAIQAGTLDIASGTVQVAGAFANTGSVIDAATLQLFGSYDAAGLERIGGSGGTLELGSTLINTGGTLDGSGIADLSYVSLGTVVGGTITNIRKPGGGLLDGVTWLGTLDVQNTQLTIKDGLLLTGTAGSGPGSLLLGGGTLTFHGATTLDNTTLNGYGDIVIADTLAFGHNLDLQMADFGFLTIIGSAPNNGTLVSAGTIDVAGQPVFPGDQGVLASIAVARFENLGTVEASGSGGSGADNFITVTAGTFTNDPGAMLGVFAGHLLVAGATVMTNNGTIVASTGVAHFAGQVLGTGLIDIGNGASVEFGSAVFQTQTIELSGSSTLAIDLPAFFAADINGFAPGDTIALGVSATATSYTDGDLKLAIGSGQTADMHIFGPYSLANFVLTPGTTTIIQVNGTSATAPVIAGTNGPITYASGGAPIVIAPSLTISDAGAPVLTSATITISAGSFTGDGDELFANTTGTAIGAKYDSSTEVLNLSGADTLADYQQVLASITFSSLAVDATDATSKPNRTVTWSVNDGSAASAPATTAIAIQPPPRTLAWTGVHDGNIANAGNWNDATNALDPAQLAPDAADSVQFQSGGGALSGSATLAAATFGGALGWALNSGGSLAVGSGISDTGALTVSDGATIVSRGSVDSIAGTDSVAGLTVTGAGANWTSLGTLVVGQQSTSATLSIQNHGVVAANGLVIARQDGAGAVTVSGNGTLRDNAGVFVVGASGLGSLQITAGGQVATNGGDASIAADTDADGSSVIVGGAGSKWQVSGALDVGDAGLGSLGISNGGGVNATNVDAGVSTASAGLISVTGSGSSLSLSGQLAVGDVGSGQLSIGAGATVSAANAAIGIASGASGTVSVQGSASHFDIAGTLNIGEAGNGALTIGTGGAMTSSQAISIGPLGVLTMSGGVVGTAAVFNSGSIQANGMLTLNTKLVSLLDAAQHGEIAIGHASDLVLNAGSVAARQVVTFDDGTGVLTIGTLAGFAATIGSFAPGDTILADAVAIASQSFDAEHHVLTLFDATNTSVGTLQFAASIDNVNGLTVTGTTPCFVAGTRISAQRGEICVQDLVVGELVQTMTCPAQPIAWIGRRTIDCRRHPEPRAVWPVRIAAGAFGPGRPIRDLYLSPDHAVYIGEVLVPVKYLINDTTIMQVPVDEVTYHHVELPRHAILLAEGLPTESYLDTGDRTNFVNGGGPMVRYPDFSSRRWEAEGCAPLVVAGRELAAARCWVNGIAGQARLAA